MNKRISYLILPSPFGPFAIVWQETGAQTVVQRVILPNERTELEVCISAAFGHAQQGSHPAMRDLAKQIQAFLQGRSIAFALDSVALHQCSEFQRRVLIAEHNIPRGRVSTYGLIAAHLGVERGARAVGNALARNPFPLIIPCHRAIRSDGGLGGYQGGLSMKRRLLEMEGLQLSQTGKVIVPQLYYYDEGSAHPLPNQDRA